MPAFFDRGTVSVTARRSLAALAVCATAHAQADSTGYAGQTQPVHILTVGPGQMFQKLSDASDAAQPGYIVKIEPGIYEQCAIWKTPNLTVVGSGVTIKNRTCENKAIFVIKSDNVTVRGITFTGAKVPDHNGAGIRMEGDNLTVESSRFVDNEAGILSGGSHQSTIVVRDSYFKGNGTCEGPCAHGIYIGHIRKLIVERSEFVEQHIGHHVKSRALRTELTGNVIRDGPRGNSSYLVDVPDGGALVMRNNRLEKGPGTDNRTVAVIIGAESINNPTPEIVIENNAFTNHMVFGTSFVRNLSTTPAFLRGNILRGTVQALDGPGSVTPFLPTARSGDSGGERRPP